MRVLVGKLCSLVCRSYSSFERPRCVSANSTFGETKPKPWSREFYDEMSVSHTFCCALMRAGFFFVSGCPSHLKTLLHE